MKQISINAIAKSYFDHQKGSVSVLENISLHAQHGELVAVVGPSGCGKTTLLNCIAGLTRYDSGSIMVGNKHISINDHSVSYMMQDDCLYEWKTVLQNTALPLEIKGASQQNACQKARNIIKLFGLEGFEHYYPSMLSGGMRQRVALARTYLTNHDVIIMDEPFSRLDNFSKISLHKWFLNIWSRYRKTVIFVTHDIDEAIFLSDRIYVFSNRPAKIVGNYSVKFKRPRSKNILSLQTFISLKKNILEKCIQNDNF